VEQTEEPHLAAADLVIFNKYAAMMELTLDGTVHRVPLAAGSVWFRGDVVASQPDGQREVLAEVGVRKEKEGEMFVEIDTDVWTHEFALNERDRVA
jgi:hypothetical protein